MVAGEPSFVSVVRNSAVGRKARDAQVSGGNGGGETPLPIPNREVKPSSADGTARETVWESRTPPGVLRRALRVSGGPFRISGLATRPLKG